MLANCYFQGKKLFPALNSGISWNAMCCPKTISEVWTTYLRPGGNQLYFLCMLLLSPLMALSLIELAGCIWRVASSILCPSIHECCPPQPWYSGRKERPGKRVYVHHLSQVQPIPMPGQQQPNSLIFHHPNTRTYSWEKSTLHTSKLRIQIAIDMKSLCFSCSFPIFLNLWKRPLHLSFSSCYDEVITFFFFFWKSRKISEWINVMDEIKNYSMENYFKEISGNGCFVWRHNYKLNCAFPL